MPGKVAEEQPGDGCAERAVVRVPSAVLEAPRGQVEGREVGGVEAVPAREGDRVAQDRTRDGVG